jgi:trigger factor
MQVTETLSTGLKREYKVVVNAAELGKQLDTRLTELSGTANIKGFRPGKVPASHLKRVYGKSVMAEVVQKTIDDQSKKVLEERNLKPAYQPQVTLPENETEVNAIMDGKGDLAFSLTFEVIPEFEVKDVTGIELTRHVAEVTEAQVSETLDRLAAQNKSWEPKDGAAETGNRVTISFIGRIEGKVFDGGTADDIPLELGSGQFIPGFEDQLMGVKAGDEKMVNVTFPETYGVKELAGKPASFDVKVKGIEVSKPTPVDDELAKKVGYKELSELKDDIKKRIGQDTDRMTAMKLKRDVLDALDGLYSFELPERLVESEFEGIWRALTSEMKRANKSFEDEKTTEEEARKEYRKISERRVRLGLVLGTMGEKEGITVTDQEMQQALISRARQFPGQEKQVFDYYRKNPNALIELRGPVFEQKVVDLILSKAKVSDKTVTREELQAMVADEEEDEAPAAEHDHHDHDHQH